MPIHLAPTLAVVLWIHGQIEWPGFWLRGDATDPSFRGVVVAYVNALPVCSPGSAFLSALIHEQGKFGELRLADAWREWADKECPPLDRIHLHRVETIRRLATRELDFWNASLSWWTGDGSEDCSPPSGIQISAWFGQRERFIVSRYLDPQSGDPVQTATLWAGGRTRQISRRSMWGVDIASITRGEPSALYCPVLPWLSSMRSQSELEFGESRFEVDLAAILDSEDTVIHSELGSVGETPTLVISYGAPPQCRVHLSLNNDLLPIRVETIRYHTSETGEVLWHSLSTIRQICAVDVSADSVSVPIATALVLVPENDQLSRPGLLYSVNQPLNGEPRSPSLSRAVDLSDDFVVQDLARGVAFAIDSAGNPSIDLAIDAALKAASSEGLMCVHAPARSAINSTDLVLGASIILAGLFVSRQWRRI